MNYFCSLIAKKKNPPMPAKPSNKLTLINRARDIIRGEKITSTQLEDLCRQLVKLDLFSYATEILLLKIKQNEEDGKAVDSKDYQCLAKFIYKDQSLPSSFKFEKALQELKIHNNLLNTANCETLGLAGAIYKRKWLFDHQTKNIELSRSYYKKGFDSWKHYIDNISTAKDELNDSGYTAINYAYISELMAVEHLDLDNNIIGTSNEVIELIKEAKAAREMILKVLLPLFNSSEAKSPWMAATIAEAYFGLYKYDEALKYITTYISLDIEAWEIRTFSQQILSLSFLQKALCKFSESLNIDPLDPIKVKACLIAVVANDECENELNHPAELKNYTAGKLGLSLSGGGFRASLFHIGVLAALAEVGELKNIEAISCVSGGSIIGAFYYLKLKCLMETKTDCEITTHDYIQLVKETEIEFLEGVQKNLRMNIFRNLICNFRMLLDKNYSRTNRLGELYEEHLYKKAYKACLQPADKNTPQDDNIYMGNLFINPKNAPAFNYQNDNWKRINKIPQLILNATSLNTGHNWQFTASWMGEPPDLALADIDAKPRLRRMYYDEAPEQYQQFRLGYAVGASSCVPVLFEPLPMYNLYPNIDLQLIDGGLHDNQGISALINQECNSMIVSDASGQMPTNDGGISMEASVFFRADSILQERLRETQFQDILARESTSQINDLTTVHLKKDLHSNPISWINCTDMPRKILETSNCTNASELTEYGILFTAQKLLAEIRTDLDSFNDVEAYSLMYSGYRQTCLEYNNRIPTTERLKGDWNFLKIEMYLSNPTSFEKVKTQLDISKKVALKLWYLSVWVRIPGFILGAGLLALLGYLSHIFWQTTLISVSSIVVTVLGLLMASFLSKFVADTINLRSTIKKWLALATLSFFGWLISNLYCFILNPLYNKLGKLPKKTDR